MALARPIVLRIKLPATVGIIQEFFENFAVMHRGVCNRIAADEFVLHINADVIFVAIVIRNTISQSQVEKAHKRTVGQESEIR